MKKLIALLLTALIVSACIPCTASAYVLYDANTDGKTRADDARLVLRCSVGLEEATAERIRIADTDSDGRLTAADARNVLRYSVGLSEESINGSYALDSLIIKVKSEYVIDDSFEIAFLYNKMVRDYEILLKAPDGGLFVTVYLKIPGRKNLLSLKEYYEGIDAVEYTEFNWISQIS